MYAYHKQITATQTVTFGFEKNGIGYVYLKMRKNSREVDMYLEVVYDDMVLYVVEAYANIRDETNTFYLHGLEVIVDEYPRMNFMDIMKNIVVPGRPWKKVVMVLDMHKTTYPKESRIGLYVSNKIVHEKVIVDDDLWDELTKIAIASASATTPTTSKLYMQQ